MDGQRGTIVELTPHDSLGWIELDSGGRVRFGGTALSEFRAYPAVGTRVVVWGTVPGFRGVPKAVRVTPFEDGDAPESAETQAMDWPTFVATYPRFGDAADVTAPCTRELPPLKIPTHPLFAPWHREITETAPATLPLRVPTFRAPRPIEPTPSESFAHGRVAFLESPAWPSCARCSRPLEMCIQIAPDLLASWLPRDGRGLVAMFCFHCITAADGLRGFVQWVRPSHRVLCPDPAPKSASSSWLVESQRVTPGKLMRIMPSASYYQYRSVHAPHTAASALFGFEPIEVSGSLPDDIDPDLLDDPAEAYEEWREENLRGDEADSFLGGVPSWDQADETPSCPAHGPMRHLLDYNGGQFLDGALHVFVCGVATCRGLASIAEF